MDFKKLLKTATDTVTDTVTKVVEGVSKIVENTRPENPQVAAIEDLLAREIKFETGELSNLFYSAGGGYLETIKGDDIQRLRNARALFGHLKNSPRDVEIVGYLTPDPNGAIIVVVNGTQVDRLTKESVKRVRERITSPIPVKIAVSIIPNRDPAYDRPHLRILKDNRAPKF